MVGRHPKDWDSTGWAPLQHNITATLRYCSKAVCKQSFLGWIVALRSSAACANEKNNNNNKKLWLRRKWEARPGSLSISHCITSPMQRMKRTRPECKRQTFIRRVMRDHRGSVGVHPNEGKNIPRHPRLENKDGNERHTAVVSEKQVALWETEEPPGKQLRDLVLIEWWESLQVWSFNNVRCSYCQ